MKTINTFKMDKQTKLMTAMILDDQERSIFKKSMMEAQRSKEEAVKIMASRKDKNEN